MNTDSYTYTGIDDIKGNPMNVGDTFTAENNYRDGEPATFTILPLREGSFWATTNDYNKDGTSTLVSPDIWGNFKDRLVV